MRFSLRWLLVAVLFIAISVVALLNANTTWVTAFRTVLVLALPMAVIGGIFSTGRKRAFWIGFSLMGFLQLFSIALNYVPPFHNLNPESADRDAWWLHKQIVREEKLEVAQLNRQGITAIDRPNYGAFLIVYHCVKTLALAVLGGYLAMWFYSRRETV